jgi:hypothetical protein
MEPPKIDLIHPDQVIKELFEDDRWVKDEFANHLAADLTELSERLAACFRALPQLNTEAEKVGTQQAALVAGFAFGVVDDLLISTKLLISGKLMAAGNLMRQAVEGIAVAVLCSNEDLLIIEQKKNTPTTARYWEKLVAGDPRVHGHRAVALLAINQTSLGISADAVTRLKQVRSHYNLFSHPGTFGLASRVSLGQEGQVYAGGHFDIEKLEGYRIEVRERSGLCGVFPNLIDNLVKRMGA